MWGGELEFAQLIRRSTSWVKHASAGLIPLPWDTAVAIGFETGVCPEWLFKGDTNEPPWASGRKERFNFAYFESYRANFKGSNQADPFRDSAMRLLPTIYRALARILHRASGNAYSLEERGKQLGAWCVQLEHSFGRLDSEQASGGAESPHFQAFYKLALKSAMRELSQRPKSKIEKAGQVREASA
jgi:hypothetical protein